MESHTWLNNRLVRSIDHEMTLLIVEANSEAKAGRHVEADIALHNQVLCCHVGGTDGLTDLKTVYEGV